MNLRLSGTEFSQINLEFENSLLEYIYDLGIDEQYGARPLKRTIETEISTPIARKLLNEEVLGGSSIIISMKGEELQLTIKKNDDVSDPPFYLEIGAEENE